MQRLTFLAVSSVVMLLWLPTARAQGGHSQNPECLGVTCSAQHQEGGGCGCGCGCGVWVAGTGQRDTIAMTDDTDGDGIEDVNDNCPTVPNRDQADSDGDGVGDACDNCPRNSNRSQANHHRSHNSKGDACNFIESGPYSGRLDADGDGIPDDIDNCPLIENADQAMHDGPRGDACNPDLCRHFPTLDICVNARDSDGDGIPDFADICPLDYDPGQETNPFSGLGVACNSAPPQDLDGDGVINSRDNCPGVPNPNQRNTNHAPNPASVATFGVDNGFGDLCYNNWPTFYAGQQINGVAKRGVPISPYQPPTFTLGGTWELPRVGQTYHLEVVGNRNGAAADYTATVISAPAGSRAVVGNPVGGFNHSDNFRYETGLTFTPDRAGVYRIQLASTLNVPDRAFPSVRTSTDEATFMVATDTSSTGHTGGCNAGPASIPAIGVGIALLGILRRRRR